MQIVKEELTEAGLTIIIKGKMNPAVACKLLPGGYSFMFEPDGMVKITLKLKDAEAKEPNAGESSTSAASSRDTGGQENIHAVEGRTGNIKQNARKENVKSAKKKEKVQTVRRKK